MILCNNRNFVIVINCPIAVMAKRKVTTFTIHSFQINTLLKMGGQQPKQQIPKYNYNRVSLVDYFETFYSTRGYKRVFIRALACMPVSYRKFLQDLFETSPC